MSGRLKGKVAIVTGGGSGFGRAITQRFVEEGALVIIGDLNHDTAQKTAELSASPENCLALRMDATKENDWVQAVQEAEQRWKRLDIVVNNAGSACSAFVHSLARESLLTVLRWTYSNRPTDQVSESDFDKIFLVNVKSIYWSVAAAVPVMKKIGNGGSIINISSIGSQRPRPGLVWYNASKGAVSNATRGLASEYGPDKIRVNALCPLLSNTGLFEAFVGVPHTEENIKQFVSQVPLGRLTEPRDVANAALYLASDEGSFCTGLLLDIDGGKGI